MFRSFRTSSVAATIVDTTGVAEAAAMQQHLTAASG